jgi:uncharacterized protein YlxW (UPF0749 family)
LRDRHNRWHLSLTIVFLILGFLLATAFTTQRHWGERAAPRKKNLIEFIDKQRVERELLGADLADLRKQVDRYALDRAGTEGRVATYRGELEALKQKAGLTAVSGPGLEILVGDAPRVPPGADPAAYLIHDYDLQILVNALWRGGAQALAVNDERFVVNTGIRSAGSTILINAKPQGGPYVLRAIGKPAKLRRALSEDEDAALLLSDYSQQYGLVMKISAREKLSLPAYTGSLRLTTMEEIE